MPDRSKESVLADLNGSLGRAIRAEMGERPKQSLGIPENERRDLLDILLRINKVAMHAFDCIEADAWSMDDLYVMLALPDTCNEFTAAMTKHAHRLGGRRG